MRDHFPRPGGDGDAVRDRRRREAGGGQQLRHVSAGGEAAAERGRPARSERRTDPVAQARPRRRLRQPGGSEGATRPRGHRRVRLPSRRPCRRHDDDSIARASAPATPRRRGSSPTGIEQGLRDDSRARAGTARPRTLVVFGRERLALRGLYASGGIGFLNDMLDVAGGTNVFADVKVQAVQASTEQILAQRPDVILEVRAANSAFPSGDRAVRAERLEGARARCRRCGTTACSFCSTTASSFPDRAWSKGRPRWRGRCIRTRSQRTKRSKRRSASERREPEQAPEGPAAPRRAPSAKDEDPAVVEQRQRQRVGAARASARRCGEVAGLLTSVNETAAACRCTACARRSCTRRRRPRACRCTRSGCRGRAPTRSTRHRLRSAVDRAVAEGFTHVAFGDLFLEDVRRVPRGASHRHRAGAAVSAVGTCRRAHLAREMIARRPPRADRDARSARDAARSDRGGVRRVTARRGCRRRWIPAPSAVSSIPARRRGRCSPRRSPSAPARSSNARGSSTGDLLLRRCFRIAGAAGGIVSHAAAAAADIER